ncbi:glutamine synthetase family protein [Oceanibaculum sp.]|uniref:glutamine synthetase family protein n=1 Tax=Oceanibaculum sp. TaxID=1903597 RepID=UPI00258D9E87|nr:glutamine synthetase [Oceanibaculum sp.]MCH2393851.1 glutamine synthetase [Oceanibaculum sp.]
MQAREVKTAEEARRIVEARGLSHVKVGVSDIDGVLRGKYMARDKFFSALEGGFGFCDVVLGWDSQDELYDNTRFTGWHTAYPDAPVRILPESCRELPFEDNMLFFLGEFADKAETVCPRGTLRRVLDKAESMGFKARAAFEYEFFLFDETPDSIREKGYYGLKPITPGMFGYSVLRSTVHADFYHALLELSERMDFPIEGLHTETGPGVLEAAISVDDALAAADKAALFKSFTKVLAQRNGMMATFMAKWSPDYPGQSGHLHLSLTDRDGKPVFHDPAAEHGMSPTMRHFLGGQQRLMPEMLALIAPTVNSFSRLIPGYWAPIASLWGVENRTCALRLIGDSPKSKRIEYRVAAADGNPYLVQAAALASGLWGIENEIEPEAPVKGNAYEVKPPSRLAFPATLWEAAQKLRRSKAARQMLGEDFVEHFAATREWEERQYRKHISDWELHRYFEII